MATHPQHGIVEEAAAEVAERAVQAHAEAKPHHQPPCPFLQEHRGTVYWVLGGTALVGSLVLGYVQQTASHAVEVAEQVRTVQASDVRDIQVTLAEVRADSRHVREVLDEVKAALRHDSSHDVTPR